MAIRRSIDDLPEGCPPDPKPRFVQLLAEKWQRENEAAGAREHAIPGTRFRHSDAAGCARLLAYKAAGVPPSNPMDLCGIWNTRLGTLIHDEWQKALIEAYPDAEIEVIVGTAEADRSGHIDALFLVTEPEGRRIAYELKSIGGYGFKAAVGKIRRGTPPEGPRLSAIVQGALGADDVHADELVVGLLGKETISTSYGMGDVDRFGAEWTFVPEQYRPIAAAERERVTGILARLDAGELPARVIPGVHSDRAPELTATITDPSSGTWQVWGVPPGGDEFGAPNPVLVDTGTTWHCDYCSHQDFCNLTDPGRMPAEVFVQIGKGLVSPCAVTQGTHLEHACGCESPADPMDQPCPRCGHDSHYAECEEMDHGLGGIGLVRCGCEGEG
jgi:hypothetical protein